jgi:hypothetical protein
MSLASPPYDPPSPIPPPVSFRVRFFDDFVQSLFVLRYGASRNQSRIPRLIVSFLLSILVCELLKTIRCASVRIACRRIVAVARLGKTNRCLNAYSVASANETSFHIVDDVFCRLLFFVSARRCCVRRCKDCFARSLRRFESHPLRAHSMKVRL